MFTEQDSTDAHCQELINTHLWLSHTDPAKYTEAHTSEALWAEAMLGMYGDA